ncbi:hypothetical protein D9M68_992690 [compost metagenome]
MGLCCAFGQQLTALGVRLELQALADIQGAQLAEHADVALLYRLLGDHAGDGVEEACIEGG